MSDAQPHCLVVVFLRGGADALNLVVPYADARYYALRPVIGKRRDALVIMDDLFGLHTALAPLEVLYKEGDLGIVHCCGSDDTTRSHFEAQDLMERGGAGGGGWLSRYLYLTAGESEGALPAVAIGKGTPESLRGATGALALESFEAFRVGAAHAGLADALGALYVEEAGPLGQAGATALDAMETLGAMADTPYEPESTAHYGADEFSVGLMQIAQLVKSGVGLRAATIDLPGWDSHFVQQAILGPLAGSLAQGLAAFWRDLGAHRAHTTVVAMSEFGRRSYENASFGTDHGRGGALFVLGGPFGGAIRHDWQGLSDAWLEGPGDLPVQFDYRDVLKEVLAPTLSAEASGLLFPEA